MGIKGISTSMSLMLHLMHRLLWLLLIIKKHVCAKYLSIYSEGDRYQFQCNKKVTSFILLWEKENVKSIKSPEEDRNKEYDNHLIGTLVAPS